MCEVEGFVILVRRQRSFPLKGACPAHVAVLPVQTGRVGMLFPGRPFQQNDIVHRRSEQWNLTQANVQYS